MLTAKGCPQQRIRSIYGGGSGTSSRQSVAVLRHLARAWWRRIRIHAVSLVHVVRVHESVSVLLLESRPRRSRAAHLRMCSRSSSRRTFVAIRRRSLRTRIRDRTMLKKDLRYAKAARPNRPTASGFPLRVVSASGRLRTARHSRRLAAERAQRSLS
jgi:hypothetical protein